MLETQDDLLAANGPLPEPERVEDARREALECLVECLTQGELALILRADATVPACWLTTERIERHLAQILREPARLQVWARSGQTWVLSLRAADETTRPDNALWGHSLRTTLVESLEAEWRAAEARRARMQPGNPAAHSLTEREAVRALRSAAGENVPTGLSILDMFALPTAAGSAAFTVTPVAAIPTQDSFQEHLSELNELLEIIVNRQLHTQFQPIVHLRDGQTLGYEALIRGPKGTLLRRTGAMLRAADKARLVAWLDLACQDRCFARAAEQGIRHLLFINMEAEGLAYLDQQERSLAECAREHGLSPASIVVEITERQTVEDFPRLLQYIERLREQGFKIAIDDAGAGYSSLHAIAELRPEFIKVDRSLVNSIDVNGTRRALLSALAQYAQHIGSTVLAEGIETREELATLIDLGIVYGQGYLMGKPADDLRGVPRDLREFMRLRTRQHSLTLTGRQPAVGALARPGKAVAPDTPLSEVARRFAKDPRLTSVVVMEEGYARGLVMREQLSHVLGLASAAHVGELLPAETVAQWMRTNVLTAEEDTPILEVMRQVTARTDISLETDIVVARGDNQYLGVLPPRLLMEAATAVRENQMRYADPLTGLPGRVALEEALQERIAQRAPLAVIRADINGLSAFNRCYGLVSGDSVLLALARLLRETLEACGRPGDFLAHLGGDDFVLLTHPETAIPICRALTTGFDRLVPQFYSAEHVRQNYTLLEDRAGNRQRVPLFSLAVAGQTNLKRRLTHYNQVMELLEEPLRYAKAQPGSYYIVDQGKSNHPLR